MQDKIIERTIYLNRDLEKRLEEVISNNPSLNFTVIVNQALKEWLNGGHSVNLAHEYFITDAPKGFGPTYKIQEDECRDKGPKVLSHFRWRK